MIRDPHARVLRQLAARAGTDPARIDARAEPWASVTFAGARHRFALTLPHADALRLLALGPDDLAIPGHLVADVAVTARDTDGAAQMVEIDVLTLEQG